MKFLSLIFAGIVLFALFMVFGLRASRKFPPDDLKDLRRLLSPEWKLVTWGWWDMGWFARFEFQGRKFQVGSHRGYIEVCETVGTEQRVIAPERQSSPEDIYELLAKAVA